MHTHTHTHIYIYETHTHTQTSEFVQKKDFWGLNVYEEEKYHHCIFLYNIHFLTLDLLPVSRLTF
ncbi:hypothetical protein SRHO_G00034490 [Serrasalmus rhombeus]